MIHAVLVGEDFDAAGLHVDPKNVMADIVSQIHSAVLVENNSVSGTFTRQSDKDFRFAIRRDFADRLLFFKIDCVDISRTIALRPFDSRCELFGLRQWRGNEQFFVRLTEEHHRQRKNFHVQQSCRGNRF